MPPARPIRRSPLPLALALALAIGLAAPLALSGCGEGPRPEATAAAENRPMVSAKDSMDYFKKSQAESKGGRRR